MYGKVVEIWIQITGALDGENLKSWRLKSKSHGSCAELSPTHTHTAASKLHPAQ
jgi:hypothetical protein